MASSSLARDSHKRTGGYGFSAESFCLDFCDGVYSSCNKRRRSQIIHQKVLSNSSSSSFVHPAPAGVFTGTEDTKTVAYSRSHCSLPSVSSSASSSASALTDTADSSIYGFSLPHADCACSEKQSFCCASCASDCAGSFCGEVYASELDIAGFLLQEVWDDVGSEGGDGDALAFNPETVFLNGGPSTDCSEDVALAGCSAEDGNWFLNELEGEGYGYLNEVLDQEWMASAMANLDRINDTLDTDLCVVHLFESDHADGAGT